MQILSMFKGMVILLSKPSDDSKSLFIWTMIQIKSM